MNDYNECGVGIMVTRRSPKLCQQIPREGGANDDEDSGLSSKIGLVSV